MPGENIKAKVCSKCGKELPMTDEYFYKRGDRYRSECKECVRKRCKEYYETHKDEARERVKKFYEAHKEKKNQYSRDYYARVKDKPEYKEKAKQYSRNRKENRQRLRDDFLAQWKRPCQKCGEQRLYLIQFHHVDPSEKEFDVSTNISYKKRELCEEEVKKCVCLCSNCHDEFHYFYGAHPEDPVNALKEYLNN